MAKNRDINYNDWTKNTARRQGVWVSYRNPNDNTYYAVKDTGSPFGRIDPDDENKTIYDPMTTAQLIGEIGDYGLGLNVYNHGRYGIRHITKKVLKTEYKVFDTRYRVEGRVERGVNYGPGIKEFGSPDAKGLTFEFSREQSPKGKYLVCIRMTQAYVDEWVFFGQPPPIPEPTEEEAEKPEDEREGPVDEDENGNVVERQRYETLESERVKQKTASTSASEIRKAFTLKNMQENIERGEQVLKEYAKILRKEGITPEDLNGFDISRQTRLYRKSYAKVKQLLQSNDVKFDDKNITDDDKFEFVLDNKFNLMHLLSNETPDKRSDLETETKDDEASDGSPPNPDIASVFYDGFDRRDLAEGELSGSVPVFLPDGADLETPENKRATKYNLMRDRSRNRLRGWSRTTLSMLANTDKILEQHKNIGTNDLLPWTEFLSQCVYPNPCIKPVEVKQKEEEPKILTSLEETTTSTASEVGQHNAAASLEVKEKKAEQRKQEFNIIENSILNCGVDLEDMIDDLEGLYENVLDKFSFKALLSAAAEKAKNEMRNQAAIFADDVRSGVESEVRKVVDSVLSELECGVDIAKGKIEDKFMSPLKEVPGVNDLLSNFEPPEMTFDLPSIKITSFLTVIAEEIEKAAIEMIESTLISMVSEMVKDFIDCEKVIAIDGVDDKGNGLFDAFSKAAFGEANLADLIPPESVNNIAESLGIPEDRIDSLNNAISEVTNPEELLTLINGEASEAVLRRLKPIISEQLSDIANMTIEVLASYLARIGDTAPEELKDQIFEAKTQTVFCNDLDYQDAAQIMKDILGPRAEKEAKAAFDRNKDKLKSLCGLKESAEENLTEAVTEMKMPRQLSAAMDLANDSIIENQVKRINDTFDALRSRVIQSANNLHIYTSANYNEYPIVDYNINDGFFRLGKWALATNNNNRQYSYTIASRGGMTTRNPYNISIPQGDQAGEGLGQRNNFNTALVDGGALFTNVTLTNKLSIRKDIQRLFGMVTGGGDIAAAADRRRSGYFNDMQTAVSKLYEEAKKPIDGKIKNASSGQEIKNIALLGVILRAMLPFAVNGFRTLARGGAGVTPLWFPNDIITNKLVTEYVYELIFSDDVDAFYISQSKAQYGDPGRDPNDPDEYLAGREPDRRSDFNQVRIPSVIRQQVRQNMSNLYAAISGIKIHHVNITPGIEDVFDNENNESIASAKKVISLLLNVFLPYKLNDNFEPSGEDRTRGSQESWMNDEINSRFNPDPGLKFEFPLQALVALHIIQGFHDNNGWKQASYAELGPNDSTETRRSSTDINFQLLGQVTTKLMQKALEDDDTELSTL